MIVTVAPHAKLRRGLSACAFPDMVVMFFWEVTAGTIRRVFLVVFVDSSTYRVFMTTD